MASKSIDRRAFLRGAGVTTLVLANVRNARAALPGNRRLSFVHTHTGESLSEQYVRGGIYQEASLERINWLLRDFRTEEIHPIDPKLLDLLCDLQTLANRDDPYQVISGYRSPTTNAALRSRSHAVAEHSFHMQGKAIDVRLTGFPTRRLRELARQMTRGGVGFYPQSDFVHVDTGPVRFW